MSAPAPRRRTPTLSISLTPELAAMVSDRVRSGLYTSASELIREALRLMLRAEQTHRQHLDHGAGIAADVGADSSPAMRFATTMDLLDCGAALRRVKADASREARERLEAHEDRQESGPGLRIAPERLARLTLRE